MKVIKRNGTEVDFDRNKIVAAIGKANADVAANIESYYDGKTTKEDQNLTTDVATGSANLTVVNQVGMKLPITGTSALMLTVLAGGALMATAVIVSKKKKVTE